MRWRFWCCCAKSRELIEILERERAMHLQHLLDVIDLCGVRALQIGNAGERVWPESLEQWRQLAAGAGATILVVTGSGRVIGVYGVES